MAITADGNTISPSSRAKMESFDADSASKLVASSSVPWVDLLVTVHRNRPACRLTVLHVLGAQELANYLRQRWGAPEQFRGATLPNARTSLRSHRGIVYFNNCFRRERGGPMVGDHIDLWTGTQYYNQIIRIGAGGDARTGASLFDRADAVWFFPLPG